ncbi:MAG: DNA polymerase III subunit gamma/tau [Deltaproteobacteria bacterium]|nr:DNA polymerase III subunit gamma/tau [Deltaproteobacteria bacterium]
MPYLALARKYRPQTFEEVIGQETVTDTLRNAIRLQKLHHAYLFAGPRGVGKTSLARLFAKSLNCQSGPTLKPCNSCAFCIEITEGRSLDVLEIDGASNTSVDDVRELRDGVRYMAAGGRYKIYIIDEVHRLSNAAFNALLKTLEEPPPHVLFIFATTEADKLPLTILSRILRFDFRRLGVSEIAKRLEEVCRDEKIVAEPSALQRIAREAGGSLRDGLSLLDQAIAGGGEKITGDFVEGLLGLTPQKTIEALLQAILEQKIGTALQKIDEIYSGGGDLRKLALNLLEHCRDLLLCKVTEGDSFLSDKTVEEREMIRKLSALGSRADFERLYEISFRNYQELQRSPLPKAHFEVAVVRMTDSIPIQPIEEILARLESMEGDSPKEVEKKVEEKIVVPQEVKKDWDGFLAVVRRAKPQIGAILSHGVVETFNLPKIEINFPKGSVYPDMLSDAAWQDQLKKMGHQFFLQEINFAFHKTAEKKEEKAALIASKDPLLSEAISIFSGAVAKVISNDS